MACVTRLVIGQEVENQRCMVGTDYSSNYDAYRDEWYYYYQFWPVGAVPSESTKVLGALPEERDNLLRRIDGGLNEADCGPGFDACKTVVTIITENVIVPQSDVPIEWKYSKVEQSCSYYDYCYPRTVVTSSNLPTQQGTEKDYEVKIRTICCNDDQVCNLQVADEFNGATILSVGAMWRVWAAAVGAVWALDMRRR